MSADFAGLGTPSALCAPVAHAADRDAPASLRLRVNLLSTQNPIQTTRERKKTPAPFQGTGLFFW